MSLSFVRFCAPLLFLAVCGAGCTSSGLAGGTGTKKSTKKEDSGSSEGKGLGKIDTATATDEGEEGSNDAGEFAEPTNVAGAYLTCLHKKTEPGSAEFGCKVYNGGQADGRPITSVKNGTLLGAQANAIARLDARVSTTDPSEMLMTLSSTGQTPATKPVSFGMQLEVEIADEPTQTLKAPYDLFIPQLVFEAAPSPAGQICRTKVLTDGRTFSVCYAEQGGGGSIAVQWTRFPTTQSPDYQVSFVPENASGVCDASQKVQANYVDGCACQAEDDWIKGTVTLPSGGNPFNSPSICVVVETTTTIFGLPQAVSGVAH